MLFVCWLWHGHGFERAVAPYTFRHVSVLSRMLRRHGGHDLVCVTDRPRHCPAGITPIAMPDGVRALPNYLPKLWAWSPEFQFIVGRRFASIDLDVVIVDDLAPVLEPVAGDPVLLWSRASGEPYNTSLFALEPGACQEVWTRLSPEAVEAARQRSGRWTGDQSWVAHVLGPGRASFGEETGVMQYRPKIHRAMRPVGLRAGFMCGPYEPFSEAEASGWVKAAYW